MALAVLPIAVVPTTTIKVFFCNEKRFKGRHKVSSFEGNSQHKVGKNYGHKNGVKTLCIS